MISLYVKTHNITGLKYLGQTVNDPFKYKGSGKRWINHIKKHGYDVNTKIIFQTESKEELKEKGLYYSNLWNVVESYDWANLKLEYGDGGVGPYNKEANKLNSSLGGYAKAAKKYDPWNKGLSTEPWPIERKRASSEFRKGNKRSYRDDGTWFWIKPPPSPTPNLVL